MFKEAGYDMDAIADIDADLSLSDPFPISGRLNLRLADKRTSRRSTSETSERDKRLKMRSLHEVEVFLAGQAGQTWSYFAEVEAEDEWPDPDGNAPGFQMQLAMGAVQYKPHEKVTFAAGYASPFYSDPYNAVNHIKPVRYDWAPSNRGFTPGETQFISVSGRPAEKVFVLVAWHGNEGLLEGDDPEDLSARAVVDVLPEVSVGGYATLTRAYDSTTGKSSGDAKFNRFGGDVQVTYEELNIHGLFGIANDDAANMTENVVAVEGSWLMPAGKTMVGPVASVGRYTINDGNDAFVEAGVFLNCQFTANIRGQVGWEGDLSVPDAYVDKESRLTGVVDIGL